MRRTYPGEGFEVVIDNEVVWARLWWDPRQDRPPFAHDLLNLLGAELFTQELPMPHLVLDLREAPPVANSGARMRLGALLAAAEQYRVATTVVVGPTTIQTRDLGKLCASCAPTMARVCTQVPFEDHQALAA